MANTDIFKDAAINDNEHECSQKIGDDDIKGHIITKGVVSLENLYDL